MSDFWYLSTGTEVLLQPLFIAGKLFQAQSVRVLFKYSGMRLHAKRRMRHCWMKPYSLDLRERVLNAYINRQGTVEEVAGQFQVGVDFIYKLARQSRTLGHVEPLPHGGGHDFLIAFQGEEELAQWVKEKPDATLAELQERLARDQGLKTSQSTVSRALSRLGLGRKKKDIFGPGGQRGRAEGVYAGGRRPGLQGFDLRG